MAQTATSLYRASNASSDPPPVTRDGMLPPDKPPTRGDVPSGSGGSDWKPVPPDRLVDTQEFASILGISRAAFFRAKAVGKLPEPSKLTDRLIRWPLSEVLAWIRWGMPPGDDWDGIRGDLGFGPRGGK
jgi:predicted DNA-binding transcriptional regulator AlpA